MPATPEAKMQDLFDQALETFGGALRAGVKFQEDMTHWWNDAMGQFGSVQEWQKKSCAVLTDAIPTAQKSADEFMKVVDQNYRCGMDLLKRTLETGRCESTAEAQAKTQDIWEQAMGAMRSNAQAMAQANVRSMESWAEFFKKSFDMNMREAKQSSAKAAK